MFPHLSRVKEGLEENSEPFSLNRKKWGPCKDLVRIEPFVISPDLCPTIIFLNLPSFPVLILESWPHDIWGW